MNKKPKYIYIAQRRGTMKDDQYGDAFLGKILENNIVEFFAIIKTRTEWRKYSEKKYLLKDIMLSMVEYSIPSVRYFFITYINKFNSPITSLIF